MAGNTPFRRWKREVHEGGVADPCIVQLAGPPGRRGRLARSATSSPTPSTCCRPCSSWPASRSPTRSGTSRRRPVEGTSFAYLLGPDGADAPERHDTQYFEMLGSRATLPRRVEGGDVQAARAHVRRRPRLDGAASTTTSWELYHVAEDLSEIHDLAAQRARAAGRDGRAVVGRGPGAPGAAARQPGALHHPQPPTRAGCGTGSSTATCPSAPRCPRRWPSTCATARTHPGRRDAAFGGPADGVLLALGSVLGGWSLHVLDGRLRYVHNLYGKQRRRARDRRASLAPGRHQVGFAFDATADHAGRTSGCGATTRPVGAGDIERFTPARFSGTGGRAHVWLRDGPGRGHRATWRRSGSPATIHDAMVEVTGRPARNPLAEFEAIMSDQARPSNRSIGLERVGRSAVRRIAAGHECHRPCARPCSAPMTSGSSQVDVDGATVAEVLTSLESRPPRLQGQAARRPGLARALRQPVRRRRRRALPRRPRHAGARRGHPVDHAGRRRRLSRRCGVGRR